MSEDLKRCPCCKGRADIVKGKRRSKITGCITVPFFRCFCIACQLRQFHNYRTRKEAIKAWNNRPIEDELNKRIAELESKQTAILKAYKVVYDGFQKYEREIKELEEQLTWRDIETAPRDGTQILIKYKDSFGTCTTLAGRGTDLDGTQAWISEGGLYVIFDDKATQWLPIPEFKEDK